MIEQEARGAARWPVVGSVVLRKVPEESMYFHVRAGEGAAGGRSYEAHHTFFGAFEVRFGEDRYVVLAEDMADAVLELVGEASGG